MRGNCCFVIGLFGLFLKGTEALQKPPALCFAILYIIGNAVQYVILATRVGLGCCRCLQRLLQHFPEETALPVSPSQKHQQFLWGRQQDYHIQDFS